MKIHLSRISLGSCILFTLALQALSLAQAQEIPIATARTEPVKTSVEVAGVVTVTPGTFDEGFAIQDSTGGIYVTSPMGQAIELGDRIRVTGKILSPNQEIWLEPSAVVVQSSGLPPVPLMVKTGEVGRTTEGRLIMVEGKITGKIKRDWPWGWKFTINDGSGDLQVFIAAAIKMKIFISPKTSIEVDQLRTGQVLRITGFSGRYKALTEILPRVQSDVVIEEK